MGWGRFSSHDFSGLAIHKAGPKPARAGRLKAAAAMHFNNSVYGIGAAAK